MNTITYELSSPIKYNPGNGQEVEANFIELRAPTGEIAHLIGILKSEISSSTRKAIEGMDLSGADMGSETEEEMTAEDVGASAFMMMTTGSANMERVYTTFKEILRATALLGAEKAVTIPMINRMAYSDLENCLKVYIGNFTKASS